MSIILKIIIIIMILLSVFLTLLVAATIFRSYLLNSRHREIKLYTDAYFDEWYDYLYYGKKSPEIILKNTYQQIAVEKIFSTFLNNARSEDIEHRISSYARAYFTNQYRKDLKSPLWAKRVNALNKISEFKMPGFTNIYTARQLSSMSHLESFLYLIYLSIFDIGNFQNKLLFKNDLTEYENKKIFSRLNDETTLSLLPVFHQMPMMTKYAFLNRVSRLSSNYPIEWLESLLDDDILEMRIRALKSIEAIKLVHDSKRYLKFFSSVIWEERMLACRLAQLIGEETIPLLRQCADDENQFVKSAAINSLEYFSDIQPDRADNGNVYHSNLKGADFIPWP